MFNPDRPLRVILLSAALAACQSAPPPVVPAPVAEPEQAKPAPAPPAVEVKPDAPAQPAEDPAQKLFDRAMRAAGDGDPVAAIDHLNELVALAPDYRRAYTRLGLLLLQLDRPSEAQQAFENAIQQDSDDAVAYNHLAVTQRAEGRFDDALENYRRALRAAPDYANAHLNLGILLDIYLRDLPGALEHYEAYLRLSPPPQEKVGKWVADIRLRIEKQENESPSRP